ncbi:SLAM family member 5-like [Pseudophryne corroboree]|uniref:SLAM family member 5-like n=1 Tax=Pseudophryne corroboree TaxID=495146 RepID=UPI003081230C
MGEICKRLTQALQEKPVTSQGDDEVLTHEVFGAVGSSVWFPQVQIDKDSVYELKKGIQYAVVFHGSHTVREPYAGRGEFFPGNGTFLLRNLMKEDSGTYEHWVNMTLIGKINLQVIERVTEPMLARVNLGEDLHLECTASGDVPLLVTILRDGKIISENITRKDGNVTTLLVHCGDPDSAGTYSCSSSNPVSSKTSNVIELRPTEGIHVHSTRKSEDGTRV